MRRIMQCLRVAWLACAGVLGLAACGPALAAEAPAAETFFKPPEIGKALLSPAGRWLALSTTHLGSRIALVVFDLRDWGKVTVAAAFNDADVRDFHWVTDDRLVFEVIDLGVGGGEQRFQAGLFSVGHDGSELRNLIQLRQEFVMPARTVGKDPLPWNHRLLHVPNDGSAEVIVGEFSFNNAGELRDVLPKRLNILTGRARSLAAGAPADSRLWWFDAKGQPRVVLGGKEGRDRLHWRPADDQPWQEVAAFDRYAAPFIPRFVDKDGRLYVTVSVGPKGYSELRTFDFTRRAPAATSLVSTPGFDFRGEVVSETPGERTLGVRLETDAETTVWFDSRLKALQQEADAKLPGRVNRLSCRRCDEPDMVVLVESYSDRDPGTYLLYRADTKAWRLVGSRRQGIDPARMALVDFHRIPARDGLELPVWVTTPAGKASGPRPTVVLVHGGPWVRGGHWRWQPMAQFLASRGYLVIEPEFRGSRGYGVRHLRAGDRQWGLAMQDDVADALQWAVAKGWADARRSCIAGASYGGYATLMGLVRHPELYRCGAAWAAVTDPRLLYKWTSISDQDDEIRLYDLPRLLGDPVADADYLKSVAPAAQAARIKAPVLLAMGALDRRVPLEHGHLMRDALKDAGRPPEWIVYNDEGHGWLTLKNQVDFATRLEAFLARHLKDAATTAPR